MKKRCESILSKYNLTFAEEYVDRLIAYSQMVHSWSSKINLTGLKDVDSVFETLVSQSLFLHAPLLDKGCVGGSKIIDIGAGAGVPGIPLAIVLTNTTFYLLESVRKKCVFLRHVCDELELANVTVVNERAEVAARQDRFRGRFDFALSRAVAPLPVAIEYALPFLKTNGFLLAIKKSKKFAEGIDTSSNALKSVGGNFESIVEKHEIAIIIITKSSETPDRFPRQTGVPTKRPL